MIVHSIEELKRIIQSYKSEGKKIVWTNGCFDLLHPGHMASLKNAKEMGDILVVGLNGDQSPYWATKPGRPINNEEFRASMLDSIKYVDYVFMYQSETPYDTIAAIIPNILIKGGDYSDVTKIVGYDIVTNNGGKVISMPLLSDQNMKYSTTAIVEKIKSLT